MSMASASTRSLWAVLLALALALRLLGSAGYMPAFDHDRPALVACPDAEASAPLTFAASHHHHGKTAHQRDACPYAAAAAAHVLAPGASAPLIASLLIGLALLRGRKSLVALRQRRRGRPPPIGPPLPA